MLGLARQHSAYWRTRYEQDFLNEVTSGLAGRTATFGPPWIGERGLVPLQKSDQFGAVIRWRMAELFIDERRPDLEQGSDQYYSEVGLEWKRLMFRGENTSHGGDMTGAIAYGRENPFFATMVMFTSSVSKIYSVLMRGMLAAQRGHKQTARRALIGFLLSISYAGAVRELMEWLRVGDDDEDERAMKRAARRLSREAANTLPVLGGLVDPVIRLAYGQGSAIYSASVTDDFLNSLTNAGISGLRAAQTWAAGELEAGGDKAWPAHARRSFRHGADVLAQWTGVPWSGPKDVYRMSRRFTGQPADTRRLYREIRDIEQAENVDVERAQLRRAIKLSDNERPEVRMEAHRLFRESVTAWAEKRGPVTTSAVLGAINSLYGQYTKYEPGKPDRLRLMDHPALLEHVDDKLAERDQLRRLAVDLIRANPDVIAPPASSQGGLPRLPRIRDQLPRLQNLRRAS